jgi:hydrogenase maturation protease
MKTLRILLAGLGSPHGDDQAGWLMVDELAEALSREDLVECRKASIPIDLLDWIEPFDAVHIVDCGVPDFAEQPTDGCCFEVPGVWKFLWDGVELVGELERTDDQAVASSPPVIASVLKSLNSRRSHDLALVEVLALGNQLQRLSRHITVWVIAGQQFEQVGEASIAVQKNVRKAAPQILTSIREQLTDRTQVQNGGGLEEICR